MGRIPTVIRSLEILTTQTIIVPENVYEMDVWACGGGGGGGGGSTTGTASHGGAGGEGAYPYLHKVAVTPGQSILCTIGAAGAGAPGENAHGTAGGDTIFALASPIRWRGGEAGTGGHQGGLSTKGTTKYGMPYVGAGSGGAVDTHGVAGESSMTGTAGARGLTVGGAADGGGGGGGGAGYLGNGGNAGNTGAAGSPATGYGSGGGGGGGGKSGVYAGGAGGNGKPGYMRITWVE